VAATYQLATTAQAAVLARPVARAAVGSNPHARVTVHSLSGSAWSEYVEIVDRILSHLGRQDLMLFINSRDYSFYQKMVKQQSGNEAEMRRFVVLANHWVRKLSDPKLKGFVASPDFSAYDMVEQAFAKLRSN